MCLTKSELNPLIFQSVTVYFFFGSPPPPQLMYFHEPLYEGEGSVWPKLVTRAVIALLLLQVCIYRCLFIYIYQTLLS